MAPAAGFEPAGPEGHQISFNHQIIISGSRLKSGALNLASLSRPNK